MSFIEDIQEFERKLQGNLENIYCPIHLCLGQELVPNELYKHIRPEDWIFSYHRAHGHYMAKGGDVDRLWDEIMGMESGINQGFSGSQGFSDRERNFYCSAIVGGLVGVATGTALALKLNKSKAIVVCIFGDATPEQGVFWESLNFAALHKLPIAYICENNGLSIDVPIKERQARPISTRVEKWIHITTSVAETLGCARLGIPSFFEAKVNRECDHLNMKTMPVGAKGGM